MSNLLKDIKEISIQVTELNDTIWGKITNEYTLDKVNFRTKFNCSDSHCQDVSISNEISEMICNRRNKLEIKKRCPGKDEIGRSCIAGFKFLVNIEYFD